MAVGGFSVMDNHLHVLVRLDPDVAQGWSDEEVVRRWGRLFPPRDKSRQPLPVSNAWVQWRLQDVQWVATARARLASLSWFMKCLKEPLSRLANRQDKTRGAFFEGRFKSVAILDEESLLATCAYIDLNPVAAGIVEVPEASPHTSITTRVEHVKAQGRTEDVKAAEHGSVLASIASAGLEESLWLCPIEDRRRLDSTSSREGMLEDFPLGSYLILVDYTGRLFRDGKAAISAEVAGILERLGSTRGKLARPARETQQRPPPRPILRRQPGAPARSRRALGRAPPGKSRRLPGAISRFAARPAPPDAATSRASSATHPARVPTNSTGRQPDCRTLSTPRSAARDSGGSRAVLVSFRTGLAHDVDDSSPSRNACPLPPRATSRAAQALPGCRHCSGSPHRP